MKRLLSLILCLLLSSLPIMAVEGANLGKSVTETNFSGEVSHGFIKGSYDIDLWYVWLNTSGIHLLFLTWYSTIYSSPIDFFIGQHYFTTDGTEVFIGNKLQRLEIYEDINGNSILDANYTDGFDKASDETRYYVWLNASKNVDLIPPSKNIVNNVTHYSWSVKHKQAQGGIQEVVNHTSTRIGDIETNEWFPSFLIDRWRATLNSLDFTFDCWVENNVAYLKTGLELGTLSIKLWSPEEIAPTFENNSLTTLYSTSVLSLKPSEINIGGNWQGTEEPAVVSSTTIDIEKKEAFKLVFGENYTLNGDSTLYKTTTGLYSINSLPADVIYHAKSFTRTTENVFREYLGETSPSLGNGVELSIDKSRLIYRVCYPKWGNRTLSYDPLYIAYIGPSHFLNSGGALLPRTLLIATFIFGVAVLLVAVHRNKKVRDFKSDSLIDPLLKLESSNNNVLGKCGNL